jgi:hypothetical protein
VREEPQQMQGMGNADVLESAVKSTAPLPPSDRDCGAGCGLIAQCGDRGACGLVRAELPSAEFERIGNSPSRGAKEV